MVTNCVTIMTMGLERAYYANMVLSKVESHTEYVDAG